MPQEYAPGLPDKNVYGDPVGDLKPGQLADYVLQHHETKRRPGKPHYDMRLGSPATNLFSWAVPGANLPEPGTKKLAPQTQLHTFSYGNFEGPIREGYGAGFVRMQDKGKVLITKVTPNSIHFTIAHTKIPTRFALVRMGGNDGRDWLLINKATPKTVEGVGTKPKMKLIGDADVDEAIQEAVRVQEKIDGAHGVYQIGPKGALEAYSVNPRVTGEPIVHTERLGLAGADVPKELAGTSFRGEMYAVGPKGKALNFNEVSGILNAALAKSMEMQRAKKVKMQNAIFGLMRYKGKDVSGLPPEEQERLLTDVVKQLPADRFHEPMTARTQEEKSKLLTDIRTGKNPRTQEGIIMHMPGGAVWKHKLRQDTTGYVTGTFPGEGKRKATAGGVTFGLEEGGPTTGQVGSGFTDAELATIAKNLKEYTGRPMRLSHQGQFPETKKLRAPVFAGWETDKPAAKEATIKIAGGAVTVPPVKAAPAKPEIVIPPSLRMLDKILGPTTPPDPKQWKGYTTNAPAVMVSQMAAPKRFLVQRTGQPERINTYYKNLHPDVQTVYDKTFAGTAAKHKAPVGVLAFGTEAASGLPDYAHDPRARELYEAGDAAGAAKIVNQLYQEQKARAAQAAARKQVAKSR